ncbi:glycosyltransferase family 4 protein [Devosia sp. J2-20]|uniref:glycosyltransferase family 4 protein n=1 Tax=Devosia sp. J2-20 TaxID=3026161 RepID=UPI002499CAA7|nr:glycosyltransferase family 4 protein [Devosia sp. J2-20]WDQ99677.1 glycosyltransferase family 4 protein [Devosia sp. J2-20]
MRPSVSYVFPTSQKFRLPFHERLRVELDACGIDYKYIYSESDTNDGKGDVQAPTWGTSVPLITWRWGPRRISFQCAMTATRNDDLVILQQQNNLLGNYPIIISRRLRGKKVALFGHGKNFQSMKPEGSAEAFKRWWSRRVDWWFAYTDECARVVREMGFPADKVTVFNNAIDVSSISTEMSTLNRETLAELRAADFQGSQNIGVYVGGLYAGKRINLLLESADQIREGVPDFQLIVIGGGPEKALVEQAALTRPWVRYVGPKFGPAKTELVALGNVLLMPGAVGLVVLDAFAYGLPLVTTRSSKHGPEISYLVDGENGVIVENDEDYAAAVVTLLTNSEERARLAKNAASCLQTYNIENMVKAFRNGILAALSDDGRTP